MATILLIVIYLAFISLGIPDSLFGAAWPAIYPQFDLPASAAGIVTVSISACTTFSSLFSAKIINKFGTAAVTVVSVFLTAGALLGYSCSSSILWFCLFAIPLGLGGGAIDAGLNNYIALHYQAVHMNFLHCFYGVGVSLSPYIMSLALRRQGSWPLGYRTAALIQGVIGVIVLISLPLWKRMATAAGTNEAAPKTLSLRQICRLPAIKSVWLAFICTCAIECVTGIWGSTYLVNAKGMSAAEAAKWITFYYVGIAVGRFLAGVLSGRCNAQQLIRIGQCVLAGAVLLLLLPLPAAGCAIGLFLVGLGNAPMFPNLIQLTPARFGREISQSVIGSEMAFSYISIALLPPLFGLAAQWIGIKILPLFLLLMYAGLLYANFTAEKARAKNS